MRSVKVRSLHNTMALFTPTHLISLPTMVINMKTFNKR